MTTDVGYKRTLVVYHNKRLIEINLVFSLVIDGKLKMTGTITLDGVSVVPYNVE